MMSDDCYSVKELELSEQFNNGGANTLIGTSNKLKSADPLRLSIEGTLLDKTDSFKYLGLTLNSHLSWDDHVNTICRKVLKKISL